MYRYELVKTYLDENYDRTLTYKLRFATAADVNAHLTEYMGPRDNWFTRPYYTAKGQQYGSLATNRENGYQTRIHLLVTELKKVVVNVLGGE